MTTKKTALAYTATIVLFLSILLGLRWVWSEVFATSDQPRAVKGVLDLRGWDFVNSSSITLNGEWNFYPEAFVSYEDLPQFEHRGNLVQVPGDWRSAMPEGSDSSYGYGTYRLRILVDPMPMDYAFWIQEIQAASAIEINEQKEAAFGQPAEHPNAYTPKKKSYTASYTTTGVNEIELLVRAANFDDPYSGGIIHSIRFGSQASIDSERWYSIGFQLVTFIVLLLHGLYACILYLFNPRERAFLVFSMLLVAAGITVISSHDSLLQLWLPINFTWTLKIKLLSYTWLSYFILLLTRKFSGNVLAKKWFSVYTSAFVLYSGFLLVATAPLIYFTTEIRLFTFFYLFPFAWCLYLIGKMVAANQNDAIFLLLAATSIISSVLWGVLNFSIEVTGVYYPIDVIVAIIGFSAYWFKRYFRNVEENTKLNKRLLEANMLKDQFLANTSHELRTPLHGIMSIAESVAAREKRTMDRKSAEDMELLVTIGRRMSYLLNDLLDVARLREKRIVLQAESLSVPSVVSGVFSMLRFMAEGKSVQLKSNIAESMPPVWADEKRLVQILFNLLHNALKYTEEGTIAVSAEVRNGQAIIEVADTGVGMDEETQARVFLPYEQGPNGISDSGGIGLGLSICKQLVELHSGELTVRSEPGIGSAFRFTLPLADSPSVAKVGSLSTEHAEAYEEIAADRSIADASASAWSTVTPDSLPVAEGRANILAVDDDPVNLKVLAGILSTEPYNVRPVASAREALELLSSGPWDLIIADVMMPQMSGYELTQKVREHFTVFELPVLLLTARSEPADIYAGFRAGANDYVTKPIDAMELKYRIWSLTALKQSVHERLRMEAAYLQAQIHPHFLFNTLNSIMALSDIDSERMLRLGDAFTSYLRISFDFLNTGKLVTLAHELELVRAYLYIEQERFEERLLILWEVEPEIELLLPPLTIQPLVENAVKHGVLSRPKGGTVRIRIFRQERFAQIEVIDDGQGMEPGKVREILTPGRKSKGGIGLINTNRRLTQMYGQGLTIHSKRGVGTTVSFAIPIAEQWDG